MTQHLLPNYGSDPDGLIWGYRFLPGQPGQPITAEEGINILASPSCRQRQEFIWLHFSLANSASEPWLKKHLDIPKSFYESLHTEFRSTRIEKESESLIAVIYDILFDFTQPLDPSAISSASLWVESNVLISSRLRPLRSVEHLKIEVSMGKVFRSTIELLAHLFEQQANLLVDIFRHSTLHIDQIEDHLLANRIAVNRAELGSARRVLVRLQRILAPEPAALFRLLNQPSDWITTDDIELLQQSGEDFATVIGDVSALIERIKLLQEELTALVNEKTNNTLYVLTVVTVLALPINMVGSLFGMNVGGIPLTDSKEGFLSIVAFMLMITFGFGYLALGRKRDR
ncbi:MAG: transporter, partial [Microcystaceae cyanobacterium]